MLMLCTCVSFYGATLTRGRGRASSASFLLGEQDDQIDGPWKSTQKNFKYLWLDFTRSLGLGDFLCAVAVGPEDFVGFRFWRSAEERVHVFPDDFPVFCDLEEAAERRFID